MQNSKRVKESGIHLNKSRFLMFKLCMYISPGEIHGSSAAERVHGLEEESVHGVHAALPGSHLPRGHQPLPRVQQRGVGRPSEGGRPPQHTLHQSSQGTKKSAEKLKALRS